MMRLFLQVQDWWVNVKDENCNNNKKKKNKTKKGNNIQKKRNTKQNVQIDMSVKKYCAFGCPVYIVYNIQSSCVKKGCIHALWTYSRAI